MPSPHRSRAALVVLTGILAAATSQAAPTDTLERARQLFMQAETDEDAERWSDAIDKLRVVSQVRLTAGVRYHLALCEEHLGQLARALADYRAAEDQARVENAKDVLRTVGKQLTTLDPRVPRLTIHVVPTLPEVYVTLDGEPLAPALAGVAVPVDPGVHHVEARALNGPTRNEVVTLGERESRVLDINLGEPASPTATPTPTPISTQIPLPAPATLPAPHGNHGLASAATAVALAFAGGGAAAYLFAGSEHDHAVSSCRQITSFATNACDGLKNRVRAWDFTAAGTWSGALVAGAIAVVLWTEPNDAANHVGVRFVVGPTALGVRGRF